jgi:hypothetical protein
MLSGQVNAEHCAELRRLIEGEDRHRPLTVDLKRGDAGVDARV